MKPSRKYPAVPRRKRRFRNRQPVGDKSINMTPVVRATVAGRIPPPSQHIPIIKTTGIVRPDIHPPSFIEGEEILIVMSVVLLLFTGMSYAMDEYGFGSILLLSILLIMLAAYYGKRPQIRHRLARVLRRVFFSSFTYPGDKRSPRLSLRMPVIITFSLLVILLRLSGGLGLLYSRIQDNPNATESSAQP